MDESKAAIDKFVKEFYEQGKAKQDMIAEQLPLATANLEQNEKAQASNTDMLAQINAALEKAPGNEQLLGQKAQVEAALPQGAESIR